MAKSAKTTTSIKVEYLFTDDIEPYPANAKDHPEVQIAHIVASIRQFGFVNPILLDGKNVVVAGHGRLIAAKRVGMEQVPVIRLGHLSPEQAKALRIADNSIPEGGIWNPQMLEAELAALRAVNFELEPIGLDSIELPEIEELVTPPAKAQRSKTTIFVAVKNEDAVKARKAIVTALEKAKISHNL